MKNGNNRWVYSGVVAGLVLAGMTGCSRNAGKAGDGETKDVVVERGDLRTEVTAPGTVQPQNRLEIKPTNNGRVDEVLVQEGDPVTSGQVLCWMSSTERASLMDAAGTRGAEELAYWKDVYKASPLISPIDGVVILRAIEQGQSVNAGTAILAVSDRLIVKARVDETDIGQVRVGQSAQIQLDAYPDIATSGRVDHVSYESRLVNNVTMYEVEVVPDRVPDVFRSGMNATVTILCTNRAGILLVPRDAVTQEAEQAWVTLKGERGRGEKRTVTLGVEKDGKVEVVSGLAEGDCLLVQQKKFSADLAAKPVTTNPFLPQRPRGRGNERRGPPH